MDADSYGITFGGRVNNAIRDIHDRSNFEKETDERKTCSPLSFLSFVEVNCLVIEAAASGVLLHIALLLRRMVSKSFMEGHTISIKSNGQS
mmetsp:Transcript_26654/g.57305  ORF Transcript_26654/g.57305 Transcript_26654/m.57305 type:complete len:91 (+) Transcript_26654:1442-1714(+)